jgi:hypothetical protein
VSAGSPSRARISSRTTGVAVAVQASTRASAGREQLAELQVLGPEVVPPLADAVRLVDRDERHRQSLSRPPEAGNASRSGARRRARLAGRDLRHAPLDLGAVERRGQERRGDAAVLQRQHLVVHERHRARSRRWCQAGGSRGSWNVRLLPPPVGADQQQAAVLQQRLDRLALPGRKES